MAKLIFLLDGKLLSEYPLNKERISIGRRPSNDIHIDNLAVSGEHATILTLGKDSFLEDLNSTNGTLVNQKLIKKHVLQHNDVIEFGKYQLKYISEEQIKRPVNDGFANTVSIKPPKKSAETTEIPVEDQPSPPKAAPAEKAPTERPVEPKEVTDIPSDTNRDSQKMGHIQMLSGADSGQELLLNRAMIKLGKPGEQLAVVTKRPNGYFITHVEGSTYPQVNGQSIGVQAHALKDRDVIELSGIKMEFYFD
jgi:pSer/pThr/pTyr-binding forkhead associated (FHA) protein